MITWLFYSSINLLILAAFIDVRNQFKKTSAQLAEIKLQTDDQSLRDRIVNEGLDFLMAQPKPDVVMEAINAGMREDVTVYASDEGYIAYRKTGDIRIFDKNGNKIVSGSIIEQEYN